MAVYVDTFGRTGALGAVPNASGISYEQVSGAWSAQNGYAATTASRDSNPIVAITSGNGNFKLSANLEPGACLYARIKDANNWVRARHYSETTTSTTTAEGIVGYDEITEEQAQYATRTVIIGTQDVPNGTSTQTVKSLNDNWLWGQLAADDPNASLTGRYRNGNLTTNSTSPHGHLPIGASWGTTSPPRTTWNWQFPVIWIQANVAANPNDISYRFTCKVDDYAYVFMNGDQLGLTSDASSATVYGTGTFTAGASTLSKSINGFHTFSIRGRDQGVNSSTRSYLSVLVSKTVQLYRTENITREETYITGYKTVVVGSKPRYGPVTTTANERLGKMSLERCVNGVITKITQDASTANVTNTVFNPIPITFQGDGAILSVTTTNAAGTQVTLVASNDATNLTNSRHGFGLGASANVDSTLGVNGTFRFDTLNKQPYPPTIISPKPTDVLNRADPIRLRQTFSDPDTGDKRSAMQQFWRSVTDPSEVPTASTVWNMPIQQGELDYIEYPANTFPRGFIQWKGRDKDLDGATSPDSQVASFLTTQAPPAPIITSPLSNSIVPTSNVTVRWSSTEQVAYRIIVTRGGVQVYDSTLIQSTAREHLIQHTAPSNNEVETVSLTTRSADNYMSSPATVTYTIRFQLPAKAIARVRSIPEKAAIGITPVNVAPTGSLAATESNNIWVREVGQGGGVIGESDNGATRVATGVRNGVEWLYRNPAAGIHYEFRVDAVSVGGGVQQGDWWVGDDGVTVPDNTSTRAYGAGAYGSGEYGE